MWGDLALCTGTLRLTKFEAQLHTVVVTPNVRWPGPEVINLFFMLNSSELAFSYLLAEKLWPQLCLAIKTLHLLLSWRFISRTYFMFSWAEHEKKKFYNLGAWAQLWSITERWGRRDKPKQLWEWPQTPIQYKAGHGDLVVWDVM